ncbi:MAG: isochorismatase family protein [Candidatus Wallbacteria bacterium]|nr:isochorismatase family protein [Candidatus Wallbacteria bacterium]
MFKECYLTREGIAETAEKWLKEFRRNKSFDSAGSALLIMDMQDYFLDPDSPAFIPAAPAILPGISALAGLFRSLELPVFFTRHLNTPENAEMMGKWWKRLIEAQDPFSEICREFRKYKRGSIIKTQYDAFYRTNLEQRLKKKGIRKLVICGVMTHLCCETTARSAFCRGYEVWFPVDCTATYNRKFHESTLCNLSHGFANLTSSGELAADLSERDAHETP